MGTNTIQVQVTARGSTRKITPEQMYEFRDNIEKTTYKCFSCKLDESNSLLKMSIFECDSLFEE